MELLERSFDIVGRMLLVTVPAMFVVQFLRAKGWLAFLDRSEFKEANEFYALVARNRGFEVRHFYTEGEALAALSA